MIRHPLGLRLDPNQPSREQIYEAARLGARGVVLHASGELAPHRLSSTGRREIRHLLHSVELALVAVSLPTRRPFDTPEQLDDRIRRAHAAFAMAYELGTKIVLARVGAVPPVEEAARHESFATALRDLGTRAVHRGVSLACETGAAPAAPLKALFESLGLPSLASSIDPADALHVGIDPIATVRTLGRLIVHAYASDSVHSSSPAAPNPRGSGYPAGALDWEEYLGALEEVGYGGFLTVWPAADLSVAAQFASITRRLEQLG
jgi:sugar phosphate isomerase/epimerase